MKSVMAGEYTAPPAHGPMITEICGTTPDCQHVALKHLGITAQGGDTFLDARATCIIQADDRGADFAWPDP